jgi:hypothetical protein
MKPLPEIIKAKESVEANLLKQPGVTGVDVGYKYVGGQRTDEISIRVLVEKKKKTIPEKERVPETIEGVKTDVIERRFELHHLGNRIRLEDITLMADTTTYDPVKGGVSIGPCRSVGGYVFAGTLGAIVRDNATGNPFLLSNFHVMCIDNGWHVGDQMTQPSRVDTGTCPANVVGTLQRAALTSSVDAAVCNLSGRGYSCEIVDIGTVTGTATATLSMNVRKRGRTTGLTFGTVDSISLSVNIDYGDGIGPRTLTNQIGIQTDTSHNPKFGDHGDSGSVVVNDSRQIVGLYFAGSSDGYGVANPIAAVLSELNISICTGPTKLPIKDIVDSKRRIKEFKAEKIEIKDAKREKIEIKERKLEKFEIKEHKPEKIELETGKSPIRDLIPKLREVGDPTKPPVTPPLNPAQPGSLEERIDQLEALVGQLATFITPEMRPDLSMGALTNEADVGGDLGSIRQQLEKDANDAMQVKTDFDTKVSDH